MSRITKINPNLQEMSKECIDNHAECLIRSAADGAAPDADSTPETVNSGFFNLEVYGAKYLISAYEACGDDTLLYKIKEIISHYRRRNDFYHVRRGVDFDNPNLINFKADKNDYRDVFCAKGQCCWLGAYWYLRKINFITEDQ